MANAGNLLVSNAKIWVAPYGSSLPAETETALLANPAAPFVSPGFTNGGVTWNQELDFTEYRADQVKIALGAANTDYTITVEMTLAEITLANLAYVLADGTVDATLDTNKVTKFTPAAMNDFQMPYMTLILDTDAPSGLQGINKRRRIIFKRCLPTSGSELAYGREDQQGLPVTWTVYGIDETTAPFVILEQTPA
jgi:hypothetical protein